MSRLVGAAILVLLAAPAFPQQQLEAIVATELRRFDVTDVDVRTLSHAQLAAIHLIVSDSEQNADKTPAIRAIVRGRFVDIGRLSLADWGKRLGLR